jgi:hypothetical protein
MARLDEANERLGRSNKSRQKTRKRNPAARNWISKNNQDSQSLFGRARLGMSNDSDCGLKEGNICRINTSADRRLVNPHVGPGCRHHVKTIDLCSLL